MSSATISLFVSLLLAMIGAAGLAFVLSHPGVVASATSRILAEAGVTLPVPLSKAKEPDVDEPVASVADAPGTISIAAGDYGHFETSAEINGRPIDVMVDTGASLVALTYEDADNLGIFLTRSDFTGLAQTANGTARVAPVTLSKVSIGNITVRNVQAVVTETGKSSKTLLGMSFLGRLSRVEMRGGKLVLEE